MYYKNNKSLYRIKSKICREKNKEKIKKAKSIYYYKNKSSIIEKGRIYSNTRRKKDINYKLRHYLSTRIWYALKRKKNV